jgi:hypothetical protein
MSFKIRLNNISVPTGHQFKVFYKLNSRTPGNVTYQGDVNWGTLYGTYTGGTTTDIEINFDLIDPNPFGKQNWFKILDTVTGSYIIENIYVHEYEYYYFCDHCCDFSGGTATYFESCDFSGGTATYYQPPTITPTPTPTNTPTPTVTITNTPTPTPTPTLPVTGLVWETTNNVEGISKCADAGWSISNGNLSIRYSISDSLNCGGTCDLTQTGTATATITVGAFDTYLGLDFEGIGELEASNYELISFRLDGVEVARGNAPGGNLDCAMGPIVETVLVPGPYLLQAGTVHTLLINFTTNDPLYHVDSYYQINLSFT